MSGSNGMIDLDRGLYDPAGNPHGTDHVRHVTVGIPVPDPKIEQPPQQHASLDTRHNMYPSLSSPGGPTFYDPYADTPGNPYVIDTSEDDLERRPVAHACPKLMLVRKGSSEACKLNAKTLSKLQGGGEAALILENGNDCIGLQWENPRDAWGHWK